LWHGTRRALAFRMTQVEREGPDNPPIDESTYAGSASETGGLYHQDGPTSSNLAGDTLSEREEEGESGPMSHTDG